MLTLSPAPYPRKAAIIGRLKDERGTPGVGRGAWDLYWATLGIWILVVLAFASLRPGAESRTLWAALLALPPLVAGIDLVLFAGSHEEICRLEVARHRWLRLITAGGYGRRTFVATGIVTIVFAVWLGATIAGR